jgi:MFS family permease
MPAVTRDKLGSGIFYGWYILATVMVSGFVGAGLSQLFMGVMLKPIVEEFGWSRTALSGAITSGTLASGLLSPLFGRLADQHGTRLLISVSAMVVGLAYMGLAYTAELWHFYLAFVLGRGVASICMGGIVSMTVIANWFWRLRGRAFGLASMALPLGGSTLALIGQYVITTRGWRPVFIMFAVACVVMVVIPSAVILRRRPEDLGLQVDGAASSPQHDPRDRPNATFAAPVKAEFNWTLSEALRTPSLWLLMFGLFAGAFANGAIGFHQAAYFTDIGLSAGVAALALSFYGFSGALASVLWGILTEHVSERACLVAAMLIAAGAILFLFFVRTPSTALLFSTVFGLAARGEGSLVMIVLAQYYGRDSYGTISGIVAPFQMAGLGLGPLITALSYDLTGSYASVFVFLMGSFLVSALAMSLARKPRAPARLCA